MVQVRARLHILLGRIVYAVLRVVGWLAVRAFYRRITVGGLEHVPPHGPLVVVANHRNGLVDSLLLAAIIRRRLGIVAKASVLATPVLGPVLRLAGALPVHRRQDGGDTAANAETFSAAIERLRDGGAILIFPEGTSQSDSVLLPLRTGAARMLLAAEASVGGALDVTLLPVGMAYDRPETFGVGAVTVTVGAPIETRLARERFATEPERAVRRLTDATAWALREQINRANNHSVGHRVPASTRRASRSLLLDVLWLVLALPVSFVPLSAYGVGAAVTRAVSRRFRPSADMVATMKILTALVAYPATWIVEGLVVRPLLGDTAVLLFTVAVVPSGLVALAWLRIFSRVCDHQRRYAGRHSVVTGRLRERSP